MLERAPKLRGAGQNVDVCGPGREVLRRMGLEDVALAQKTGECGIRFVDEHDVVLAEFPPAKTTMAGSPQSSKYCAERSRRSLCKPERQALTASLATRLPK